MHLLAAATVPGGRAVLLLRAGSALPVPLALADAAAAAGARGAREGAVDAGASLLAVPSPAAALHPHRYAGLSLYACAYAGTRVGSFRQPGERAPQQHGLASELAGPGPGPACVEGAVSRAPVKRLVRYRDPRPLGAAPSGPPNEMHAAAGSGRARATAAAWLTCYQASHGGQRDCYRAPAHGDARGLKRPLLVRCHSEC